MCVAWFISPGILYTNPVINFPNVNDLCPKELLLSKISQMLRNQPIQPFYLWINHDCKHNKFCEGLYFLLYVLYLNIF